MRKLIQAGFARLFISAILALALFRIAVAGPLEDGLAAYQHGDYATALRLGTAEADRLLSGYNYVRAAKLLRAVPRVATTLRYQSTLSP